MFVVPRLSISLSHFRQDHCMHTQALTHLFGLLHTMTGDTSFFYLLSHLVCPLVYMSPNPLSSPVMQAPPMAQESASFNLHFISYNISKCADCGNKYVKPPVPPYDLCIQHKEWRSFSSGEVQQSKFAPAYYHMNKACVRRNWPTFSPEKLYISPDMLSRLNSH